MAVRIVYGRFGSHGTAGTFNRSGVRRLNSGLEYRAQETGV